MVRFKNRYLLLQSTPSEKDTYGLIKDSLYLNFGDVVAAQILPSMTLKYYSPVTGISIVRCARSHARQVQAAWFFVSGNQGRTIHIAGTIKKAQLACIQHDNEGVTLGKWKADKDRRRQIDTLRD